MKIKSIRTACIILCTAIIVVCSIGVNLVTYTGMKGTITKTNSDYKDAVISGYKEQIKDEVGAMLTVVNMVYEKSQSGEMSEKDAKKLQEMLREVVTSGTGYNLDTDLYTAAGKTGTAENEGKYAHAWFVGYSNVEDPDLVVCVLVENVGAGSKYAVPIAKRVFDSYYNNNMKEYYSQKTDIESTQTNQ